MTLQEYFTVNGQLGNEWDAEKNTCSPALLTPRSRVMAWWRCSKGHNWQANIDSRVYGGHGCPYCAGKRAIPGLTDLATTHPQLAAMWSPDNELQPCQITAGSEKKVLWRCAEGHQWESRVFSVALDKCGCPYCAGKRAIPGKTDLATLRPDLTAQWDFEKNELDPSALLPSSHAKVWWKCSEGHSWQAAVFSRSRAKSSACPYCSGKKVLPGFNDLASRMPRLAEEWYQPLNGSLRPEGVSPGSNKKVWWKCSEGHVWQAFVYARSKENGTGCPVCAGRVKVRRRAI